ncbi:hypothetical protein PG987_015021 [Apiospora arundinis]
MSTPDGLPPRQQQVEQQPTQDQLTQPRGAHLLTSTTKSHRHATNEALAADDSTPPGQEKTTSFMCFPISRILSIKHSMPFSWFRNRDEPKDAPASSSMETPSSHQPQTSSYPTDSNTMKVAGVDLNERYKQEWPKGVYEGSFKGRQDRIKVQFADFWGNSKAQQDVNAYLRNDSNHPFPKPEDMPGWVKGQNVFTNYDKPTLAEDQDVMIIGNHASFDIAQYPKKTSPAGMSMIHLLGLTKKSIYNGVSLNESNVDVIDKIIELFSSEWAELGFRKKVLNHQLNAINRLKTEALDAAKKADTEAQKHEAEALAIQGHKLAKLHWDELERDIEGLEVDDFEFGLHLYPDNSIPHFHMHIIAMRKGMRKYSTSKHDEKTKDAREVRDYIPEFCRLKEAEMKAKEAEKAKEIKETKNS